MNECRWCGDQHAVTELCRPRRVSRRSFFFRTFAGVVGLALAPQSFQEVLLTEKRGTTAVHLVIREELAQLDAILRESYMPFIVHSLNVPRPTLFDFELR